MLKIRDQGMIFLYQWFRYFASILFSRNFAYAKFRENKILAKISEFTVIRLGCCNIRNSQIRQPP